MACTVDLGVNHHNSVAIIVMACTGMASMVAKYALLCTFVWLVYTIIVYNMTFQRR